MDGSMSRWLAPSSAAGTCRRPYGRSGSHQKSCQCLVTNTTTKYLKNDNRIALASVGEKHSAKEGGTRVSLRSIDT